VNAIVKVRSSVYAQVARHVPRGGGAGHQRQQDREDGGAEPAGGEGAGGGGQEGVRDGGPGAQQPGFHEGAGGEVGGEAGERYGADEQQCEREAGGAEEQAGQSGEEGEVGRGALGAAGAQRVPGVGVPAPQAADVVGDGQEGAACEGAAAEEQAAAGDHGDQEQQGEEDGARLAGDLLEPGELLDLQVVGVVAAGARLDGAVPGAAGVGVGAGEVGRDLFDRGADGGAGRREQGAQFGAGGASAAGGEDAFGPQQDRAQAHDLVDGLDGGLADEVGEGPQEGADDEAEQDVREGGPARVGEEGVDGAGLVDAVRVGDGAAGAVDGAAFAGGGLGVAQDGVGGDEDAVAGGVGAPAQVDVVAHEGQAAVEAAELLEDVAADEHAGGGDGQDGADLVVLPLVLFAAVEAGPAASAVGDGDADFEELLAVVPAEELGADDRGVLVGVGDAQQFGEGVGGGRAVVVEEPQPLDRLAVRQVGQVVGVVAPGPADGVPAAGPLQIGQVVGAEDGRGADGLLDGGAEAGAAGEVQYPLVADGVADELRRRVGAAGVGGDDVLRGAFLAEESGEGVRQPAGSVVGDEHGGDDVPRELGLLRLGCGGKRGCGGGHRGTGPPARGSPASRGVGASLTGLHTNGWHDSGPPPVDRAQAADRWAGTCGWCARSGGGRRGGARRPRAGGHGERSDGGLLQAAALALGQAAPDSESLVIRERVFEAFRTDFTGEADLLGLAGGTALLGEEGLGIGLGAQRALLPAEFLVRVLDQQFLEQLGHLRPSSVLYVPVMPHRFSFPAERHE
jgi:hypothetical protein